jgi:hypothetical protein
MTEPEAFTAVGKDQPDGGTQPFLLPPRSPLRYAASTVEGEIMSDPITVEQVEAFVARWFSLLDIHAPVKNAITCWHKIA